MKTCEHTDKVGTEYVDCGLPATCCTTKYMKKDYCKEHGFTAVIAGFEPVNFKLLTVSCPVIDANTPDECLTTHEAIYNEADPHRELVPPHCVGCKCVLH